MNAQWRVFLAALGWVTRRIPASGSDFGAPPHQAARFVPVVGMGIGLVAGAVYWQAAQLWPTSIAVVLSMLAASLMTGVREVRPGLGAVHDAGRPGLGTLYWVFVVFIQYNALMALSSAHVPFPLPDNCALAIIMIAAQAASRALVVSVLATDPPAEPTTGPAADDLHAATNATSASATPTAATATSAHDSHAATNAAPAPTTPAFTTAIASPAASWVSDVTAGDLVVALGLGLAPAVLLGIPGLIGLVAAIVMRLGLAAHGLIRFRLALRERLEVVQHLTEVSFYLGALASWKYV